MPRTLTQLKKKETLDSHTVLSWSVMVVEMKQSVESRRLLPMPSCFTARALASSQRASSSADRSLRTFFFGTTWGLRSAVWPQCFSLASFILRLAFCLLSRFLRISAMFISSSLLLEADARESAMSSLPAEAKTIRPMGGLAEEEDPLLEKLSLRPRSSLLLRAAHIFSCHPNL